MAEGILRHYGNERIEVFSAGTKPSEVNPIAIQVMKEIGIDISGHRSKHVDEFKGQTFDYVITVCDHVKESCPVFPGCAKFMHWPFPDPPHHKKIDEEVIKEFRKVRDMIRDKFRSFVYELSVACRLKSIIKCPYCGFEKEETMPADSCQFFYQCAHCGARLKPKEGDCCVFCSYGTIKCPPKQKEKYC